MKFIFIIFSMFSTYASASTYISVATCLEKQSDGPEMKLLVGPGESANKGLIITEADDPEDSDASVVMAESSTFKSTSEESYEITPDKNTMMGGYGGFGTLKLSGKKISAWKGTFRTYLCSLD
jgi:hypothetical protein